MKVVPKNCIKKISKEKQKKSMAEFGVGAYIDAKPKTQISACKVEKRAMS